MITMNGGPLSYGGYVLSNEDLTVYGGKNAFYVESNEPLKNNYFEFTCNSYSNCMHPTGFIFGDDELYTSTKRNYRTNGASIYVTNVNNSVEVGLTYNNSGPTYLINGIKFPLTGGNITSLVIDNQDQFHVYSNGELMWTYDIGFSFSKGNTRVFMTRGWDSHTASNTFNFGDQGEGFKYKNIYDFYFKDLYKLYNKDDSVYGLE